MAGCVGFSFDRSEGCLKLGRKNNSQKGTSERKLKYIYGNFCLLALTTLFGSYNCRHFRKPSVSFAVSCNSLHWLPELS